MNKNPHHSQQHTVCLLWTSFWETTISLNKIIDFVLCIYHCASITVWFGSNVKHSRIRLKQTIRSAERIIRADLTSFQGQYRSRVRNQTGTSLWTPHTPVTNFYLLPSLRQNCTPRPRHKDTFLSKVAALMDSEQWTQSGRKGKNKIR